MCNEFNDFDDMSFIIKLIGTKKIEIQPLEFINDEINKNAKHNKVSDEIITKLKNNTAISYYYMYSYSSDLNKEFFDALRGNGSLTTLFLCINSSFNINPLINVFKSNLSNIQNLNLSRNEIINIDNLCYALKENTSLTYLNLSWNNINNITALCNYLEDNKNLKILNISHNKFTDINCFKDVLIHNKCLEELNIGYNDICVNNETSNGKGIIKFCEGLSKNNTLRVLYMEQIGLVNIEPLFESLKTNLALAVLNLHLNDTIASVDCLEEFFKNNKGLSKLSLKQTEIKNIEKMCKGLHYNNTLNYLNLSLNDLPNEQIKFLADVYDDNTTLNVVY